MGRGKSRGEGPVLAYRDLNAHDLIQRKCTQLLHLPWSVANAFQMEGLLTIFFSIVLLWLEMGLSYSTFLVCHGACLSM